MQTVTCAYCGLPFKTRGNAPARTGQPHFCCTGCAMLARVPVDEKGQFPVNAQLVSMLATGFLYFNQLLFWLLAVLLAMQDKAGASARFYWLAAGGALAVWAAIAFLQWRERAARAADVVALAIALAAHAWVISGALLAGAGTTALPRAWPAAIANAALIAWTMRGIRRGRKKQ